MKKYDFENDVQNNAARENYNAAMNGTERKGIAMFERPNLWDHIHPSVVKDSPWEKFIPMPTLGTGDTFAGYSVGRKIVFVAGAAVVLGVIGYCVGSTLASELLRLF